MPEYRKNIFRTNKYQKPILVLPFIASLVFCLSLTALILFIQSDMINAILNSKNPQTIEMINKWSLLFIIYLWVFFVIINLGLLTLSSNLVGAFERIITELELVASGKKKSHIFARKDDELAHRILKSVNQIIDKVNSLEKEIQMKEKPIITRNSFSDDFLKD